MKKSKDKSTALLNTKDKDLLLDLLQVQRARERYNRINFYDPYPYQLKFHVTGTRL